MEETFIMEHIEDLLRNIRTQVLMKPDVHSYPDPVHLWRGFLMELDQLTRGVIVPQGGVRLYIHPVQLGKTLLGGEREGARGPKDQVGVEWCGRIYTVSIDL